MNGVLSRVCLAVLLVASAEAGELVSTDGDGCAYETFEKAEPRREVYTGQKISLDFKDADVVNVLRILSEVGGENLVVTDDVKGRITVRLIEVAWDEAFDIVLQMNRLRCVRIGNVPPRVARANPSPRRTAPPRPRDGEGASSVGCSTGDGIATSGSDP